jgi:hypothetical protein
MLEVEGKLFVWLYCRMARWGLKNGWLMSYIVLAVVINKESFWWQVPVLYFLAVFFGTIIYRIDPGDDWKEPIADKRKEIEAVVNAKEEAKETVKSKAKTAQDVVNESSDEEESVEKTLE